MKIAYIAHVNFSRNSGVVKKILSQATWWRQFGHLVRVFWLTRKEELQAGASEWEEFIVYKGGPMSASRHLALRDLGFRVRSWSPDLVYLRRDMVYPTYVALAETFPTVVEINSDELAELRLYKQFAHYVYHSLSRPLLDRRVKGFVFPTRELAYSSYYRRVLAHKKVIANGIDFRVIPTLPPAVNEKPVLVFLGEVASWHGIDKICRLALAFPDWKFHLIGVDKVVCASANVVAHGFLTKEQYLPIIATADVGIGTLALHRNGMNEASPLKVREYLALGLPVIIAYDDTDFPEGAPFILRLPNTENNIEGSLAEIRRFVGEWKGRRVPRSAISHLDLAVKEKERLLFFEQVLASSARIYN